MKKLKNLIKQKEYFIFDMDGTMFDLEHINFNAIEATLEDLFNVDITLNEYKKYMAGARIKEAIQKLLQNEGITNYNKDNLIKKFRQYKKEKLAKKITEIVIVKDGLIEFLNYLKNNDKKLAVATSSHKKFVNKIFKAFDVIKFFDIIITADDVNNTKPNPEPFLKALKLLNGIKKDAVIFEDSRSGIIGAKKSGIFTIAFHTPGLNDEFIQLADTYITSYKELF